MAARKRCTSCPLHITRRNIVFGRGIRPAEVLFLGEAPGASEDLLGEAFVGPSGRLLRLLIAEAGGADVPAYFTNCVLCRPPENRNPTPSEVATCTPNVRRIIREVNPRLVVFVGETAERYYRREFPRGVRITHTAALLRKGGRASPYYPAAVNTLREALEREELCQ